MLPDVKGGHETASRSGVSADLRRYVCLSVQNKAFDAVILHTQTHSTLGRMFQKVPHPHDDAAETPPEVYSVHDDHRPAGGLELGVSPLITLLLLRGEVMLAVVLEHDALLPVPLVPHR